jgi:alkanesulfonate monooxygenase SsuD/methylene tetrahydromethanopterin reductase-like flavin-dependent oxidoreductase (luciferase family)
VRLSAFTVVDAYEDRDADDRLTEVVRLAEAADEANLSTLWVAEHHFQPTGVCPSPPVLLATLGARTHRLRLGSLVTVLPFHSPLEVAEQYAMVDRLTGGRLNIGFGSGYIPSEFEGFGVDPATKRERFDDALAFVRRALAGDEVRLPTPGAHPVRLNVRPVQRPHPPIWIAVQRREAVPHVARHRASLALIPYATLADRSELAEEVREYRAACPPDFPGEVAAGIHVYVGPDVDRAREALQRYLDSRLAHQSVHFQEKVRRDPRQASARALEDAGWAIFGSAEDVVTRLREFERLGVDELLGLFDFGGLPPEAVEGSIRSLGARWTGSGSGAGRSASPSMVRSIPDR